MFSRPFFVQAKKAKQAEIDRKRAEVRKRMEEASKAKKAKKGFMTPDRKKKLRVSTVVLLLFMLTVQFFFFMKSTTTTDVRWSTCLCDEWLQLSHLSRSRRKAQTIFVPLSSFTSEFWFFTYLPVRTDRRKHDKHYRHGSRRTVVRSLKTIVVN